MDDLFDFLTSLPSCMKPWCTTCAGRPGRERQLHEFALGRTDLGVQLASISAPQAATLGERQPLLVFLLRLLSEADLSLVAKAWEHRELSDDLLRVLAHEGTDLLRSSRKLWDAVGMRVLDFALRAPRGEYLRRAMVDVIEHYRLHDARLHAQVARDAEEAEQRSARYQAERAAARAQRASAIESADRLPLTERLQGILDGSLGVDPPFPERWSSLTDEECASVPLGLQRQIARRGMRSRGGPARDLHVRLHQWRTAERTTAHRALLSVLASLTPIEQIVRLCNGAEPVYWFPASLPSWISEHCDLLPPASISALRTRLEHVRRRDWRRVAHLLATS